MYYGIHYNTLHCHIITIPMLRSCGRYHSRVRLGTTYITSCQRGPAMPGVACCVIQPSDMIRGCIDFGIPIHQSPTHIYEHLRMLFPLATPLSNNNKNNLGRYDCIILVTGSRLHQYAYPPTQPCTMREFVLITNNHKCSGGHC